MTPLQLPHVLKSINSRVDQELGQVQTPAFFLGWDNNNNNNNKTGLRAKYVITIYALGSASESKPLQIQIAVLY